MDEAGLEQAATECAPGEVGSDADVGRFKAWVKQLRLGGETTLLGLRLPNPEEKGFDAAVESMCRTAAEQCALQPLVPAQDAETTEAEPEALGTAAGSPPLQLQQQPPALEPAAPQPPAPQPPAPQSSPTAGSAAGAPQPMEVEAPPAPAQTEAPPLLVPRSALHGLGLDDLVSQFGHVLAAAPLDGPMAGRLLDSLVGLGLSGQEMQDSGAPPTTHMPSVPAHLHRAHPPAQLSTLTLSRPRTGACKLVNKLRGERGDKRGVSAPLNTRADELFTQWTSDGGAD